MNISVAGKEKEVDDSQSPLMKHGIALSQVAKRR